MASYFASAGVVGRDKGTAVANVVAPPRVQPIGKRREDIVGAKKARRLIEKLKSGAGWD